MRALAPRLIAALIASVALASAAKAGPPTMLRQDVTASGGKVTLGDLFYDAGDAAGIVAARVQPGQMVVLDATRVQILARSNGVDWGNPQGVRRIVVQAGAAPAAPTPAPAAKADAKPDSRPSATRAPLVLTFQHSLNAGDIVRAEDLTWSREAVGAADAPREPDAVIGMAARRPLREGEAVAMHDVVAPIVIHRDDMIAVVFNLDGVSLTLQAKAMDNASAGQTLTVMNTVSKKIIQAVASGPGQALVGPGAEQIKATHDSYSRLAQR